MISLYRKIFILIFLSVLTIFVSQSHAQKVDKIVETFINNVVQITAEFSDTGSREGFGFVVGEKDDMLYIVTANHVIHLKDPNVETTGIQVRFYYDQAGSPVRGEPLNVANSTLDAALFKVKKPTQYRWERNILSSSFKKGEKVWFIGLQKKWDIPLDDAAGTINDNEAGWDGSVTLYITSVKEGTSGAPLFTENGIVGMIIEDDFNTAKATHIDWIRRLIVKECKVCPWDLRQFGASQPEIEEDVKISEKEITKQPEEEITNSIGMKFVYITPGSFMMGSPEDEPGRDNDEKQHKVTITKGFYMQTTEVTVGQWKSFVMDTKFKSEAETKGGSHIWTGSKWKKNNKYYWDNPCFKQMDSNPVTCISWNDAQEFIKWLNKKENKNEYRLSTEAEWEYAARSGKTTPFAFGDCLLTDNANYNGNYPFKDCSKGKYHKKTMPVASFDSNAWGLYDMHGNVWEWCSDWYDEYSPEAVVDPTGALSGSVRINRGGSWINEAFFCRSAHRNKFLPGNRNNRLGFRLALSLGQ